MAEDDERNEGAQTINTDLELRDSTGSAFALPENVRREGRKSAQRF
jgi:hypothetical protein